MMKKLVFWMLVICGLMTMAVSMPEDRSSDSYVRDRVLMLKGNQHQCSGVEVKGRSGVYYTLTAAHCVALLDHGRMEAVSENGQNTYVEFVAIDPAHDLMLLTSPEEKAVLIANHIEKHEKVHSLTHGHGFPTYRTDGELLEERTVTVAVFPILSQEDADACQKTAWQWPEEDFMSQVCVRMLTLMGTTTMIVPGSSGGPVLNSSGNLVGIVSAGDGTFGYLVPLRSIKAFLRNR